jgi:hypothetical protein
MLADFLRLSLALAGILAGASGMFLLITRNVDKKRGRSHD